jgi:hypothetical protein
MTVTGVHIGESFRLADGDAFQRGLFQVCLFIAEPGWGDRLTFTENVLLDCKYLYDGMEVSAAEWLALVQRLPLASMAVQNNRFT